MNKITASRANFIKLGAGGEFQKDCIERGYLRISFYEFSHDDLMNKRWDIVRNTYEQKETSAPWVSIYLNQIKEFYEASEDVIWITFVSQKMYWGFASLDFEGKDTSVKIRLLKNGWSSRNVNGDELLVEHISSGLTKVQGFRSTICNVRELGYLLRLINAEQSPEVQEAQTTVHSLNSIVGKMVSKLRQEDFEILIDLIFRANSYQRIGLIGKTKSFKDIELLSPIKMQRILVQVKSQCSQDVIDSYVNEFEEMDTNSYHEFYFCWHSGASKPINNKENVFFWDRDEIAKQALKAGLLDWISLKQ